MVLLLNVIVIVIIVITIVSGGVWSTKRLNDPEHVATHRMNRVQYECTNAHKRQHSHHIRISNQLQRPNGTVANQYFENL